MSNEENTTSQANSTHSGKHQETTRRRNNQSRLMHIKKLHQRKVNKNRTTNCYKNFLCLSALIRLAFYDLKLNPPKRCDSKRNQKEKWQSVTLKITQHLALTLQNLNLKINRLLAGCFYSYWTESLASQSVLDVCCTGRRLNTCSLKHRCKLWYKKV